MKKSRILLFIPAYNCEKQIVRVLGSLDAEVMKYISEVIVVNNRSTDGTEAILQETGVNYLSFPVNLGIGGGVQAGYQYARENGYDIAIQFDGDDTFVYVLKADGTYENRPVETGLSDGVNIEIKSGLSLEDKVRGPQII